MRAPRRGAFTLIELLVALLILGVLGAGAGLRVWTFHTPQREADRAMRWLYGVLARADRTGQSFSLHIGDGRPSCLVAIRDGLGESERLEASEGCSFERRLSDIANVTYSPQWGTFTAAMTIRVRGAGGGAHYLILSGQGRLRTAPSPN